VTGLLAESNNFCDTI